MGKHFICIMKLQIASELACCRNKRLYASVTNRVDKQPDCVSKCRLEASSIATFPTAYRAHRRF